MRQVVIVQDYVPEYRVPFFKLLKLRASENGIVISIVAGDPSGAQNARRDSRLIEGLIRTKNIEVRLFGLRLNFRNSLPHLNGADLVIFEQARRNLDAVVALFFLRSKTALWGHGRDFVQASNTLRSCLLSFLTNRASWFFGYSQSGVESVVSKGYDRARTTVVQNATDTRSLHLLHEKKSRKFYFISGIPTDAFVAVFVGAFDPSKRLDFLFEALERIKDRVDRLHMVFSGDGPQESKVLEFSKSRPWVHVTGRIEGNHLANVLSSADILLMPGRVGLIAVDALSFGLPIATTDWPYHAPEFDLLNNQNSIIASDSVSAFASEIADFAADPDRRKWLSLNALETAKNLSVEAMVEAFITGLNGYFSEV